MLSRVKKILLLGALFGFSAALAAGNAEARLLAEAAEKSVAAGDFRGAAKSYLKAELEGEDAATRAAMLAKAIENYRRTPLIYQEFIAIERMLELYPDYADQVALADREYELGDAYFRGEREPGIWYLRDWKFLSGKDRTMEVYRAALKRAPFSSRSQTARLRLAAALLLENGDSPEALKLLREVIKHEKQDQELEYAYMLLAEQLFKLAQSGDGDGKYNHECVQLLQAFKARFPSSCYTERADLWLLKLQDVQAERLLGLAGFYTRQGRKDVAERYLNQLLREYPNALETREAERALVKLDDEFRPGGTVAEPASRLPAYSAYALPEEEHELLVAPETSGGKFLLPVYKARQTESETPGDAIK